MAKKPVQKTTAKKALEPTHENIAREYVLGRRAGATIKSIAEKFGMSTPNFTAKINAMRKAGVKLPEGAKRLNEDRVKELNKMLEGI